MKKNVVLAIFLISRNYCLQVHGKKKDKYKLSILRVVKKLVPIDPTPLIIRAALGTILMFLLLMAHELAGVGGMVLVCILFAIGVSAPFWLTRRKKH
jgi:hypothetical protein